MNNRRRACSIAAVVAESLMREPCGLKQLCLAAGVPMRNTELVSKYVQAFHAAGLVYISGWSSRQWPIYRWQPTIRAECDVPRTRAPVAKSRADAGMQRVRIRPADEPLPAKAAPTRPIVSSVFALGGQV